MDLYKFEDEQSVYKQAEKVLQKIFSDKSYANPQKISLLLQQYQKKQIKLDAQLSKTIKSQIDCIKQSRQSVQQANNHMKQAEQRTDKINQIWLEQVQFHDFMEDIITLHVFQTNVGKVIEQLSYFIDMQTQMQNLQRLAEDESKYLIVGTKLLNLIQLRDALLQDSSWQRQTTIMRKQFVKVNNFQTNFFDKIFLCFSDCIGFAKQKPETLKMAVKVIQSYDNALKSKQKQAQKRPKAISLIQESIQKKFIQQLSDEQDVIGVIQKARFATKDLVDVNDYVKPCFPKEFPIMQVYQNAYKHHIQTQIFPYFQQIEQQNQYGHLVILFGWIDDYETMLARAGLDSTNLIDLKMRVKGLMPYFIDHNRKIVEDYIEGAIKVDRKNFNRKYYQELIDEQSDFISLFPSDIFRFINQEAEIIKDQLKGQVFIQFVRCITQSLNNFQANEVEQIQNQFKNQIKNTEDQDQLVNFQYKVLMYINNFNQCLKNAGQSKQMFAQYVAQQYKTRIQKIFITQVQKQFNASIPRFLNILIQIIFTKVLKQYYPILFTPKWLNDKSGQKLSQILKTISTQLNDIEEQSFIINVIHYRNLVKQSLQYIVNAYIQQLIIYIKIIYRAHNNMEVKYCNLDATIKKLQLQGNVDLKSVFNSKVAFTQALKKDRLTFMKFADNYSQCTSKAFMQKLKNKMMIVYDLLTKKNKEFQVLPAKLADLIPAKANELIQVVFIIRQDIQNRASQLPRKGMGYQ